MDIQLKDFMQAILMRYNGWLYHGALASVIYLVDITSVKRYGRQVTDIQWYRNNYGPFAWNILDCAKEHSPIFEIHIEPGNQQRITVNKAEDIKIPREIEALIDEVVHAVPNPQMSPQEFKEYVYETAPMLLSRSNGPLDIKKAIATAQTVDEVADTMLNTKEWDETFEYLATH
jgi:hypothetical protein